MWCSRRDLGGTVDVEGTLLSKVAISILILSDPLMISLLAMMAVYMNSIAGRAASSGHLDVQLPLRCASIFVDLHDRILYPSAVLAVGSFVCSPWMILLSRDLATLVHHLKHLLIIGGIVHRKLIGHLILPPHLLVNESLILLFVIGALVPLMVATAGPLLRLLSLALLLCSGKLLLLAVTLLCRGTSGSHAWLPYHDLDACRLAMVNDSPVVRCRPLRMVTLVRLQIDLLRTVLDLVVLDYLSNDAAYIILVGQLLKYRGDPVQFGITHIVVPAGAGNGIFRLPKVSDGRIVDDDDVGHWPTQTSEILHEGIVELCTMLTKELVLAEAIWVKLCDKWLSIFGQTCRENHKLIVLGHSVKELADSRPHKNVDLPNLSFNLDWQHDIGSLHWLEL